MKGKAWTGIGICGRQVNAAMNVQVAYSTGKFLTVRGMAPAHDGL